MKAVQEFMVANLREMKAEIRANNKKFEVLQGALVSQLGVHQARTEVMQEKTCTNLKEETKANKEEMRA
jgi:hypothetical protein